MSVKLRNANPASELITARKSRFAAGAEWPECVDHGVLETRISMRAKVGAALDCVKHATPSNADRQARARRLRCGSVARLGV